MPIIGIQASAISGNLTPPDLGAMFPISVIQVGSAGAANISFTSIPSTYKHLQIRCSSFTNRAGAGLDDFNMRFNSDTGSNYSTHRLFGNGTSAFADATTTTGSAMIGMAYSGTTVSSYPGTAVIDIFDYASTSKNKTVRGLSGVDVNGTVAGVPSYLFLTSATWYNSAAVNSITLYSDNAATITQYSTFALYGIKGV
jgi:hypothetical protein